MISGARSQRIRDPIHNLIEFDTSQFEQTLWRVIQSRPYQRLRRIKQLGFSEFVFPGASHSRFAHSLGVFHISRTLITIIDRLEGAAHQSQVAVAAALLHDVGHGMFSHAFEEVGKKLDLTLANHESVSDLIIKETEIAEMLNKELGGGFSTEVANLIKRKRPSNVYDSVVSSQFDADRLDYMQRDRLMTGVQGSGVDATWIMANLEIGSVSNITDDEKSGDIRTLVLGPKAFHAAEHYVLSLFQLYPNVYLHKTTRGAEKIFSALIVRAHNLIKDGKGRECGLPTKHPIYRFLLKPTELERALALDDAVFWGALHFLKDAKDKLIAEYARRLYERVLLKCIDVRKYVEGKCPIKAGMSLEDRQERDARITLAVKNILDGVREWSEEREKKTGEQILIDEYNRSPYKRFQDSQTPLNQILIRREGGIEDMAHISSVVAGAESFQINRVYVGNEDAASRAALDGFLLKAEV